MSHFLLHSYREHSFCSAVLGNNDGDNISLRFLFLLYVALIVLCGKISSICRLLCKIGKWSNDGFKIRQQRVILCNQIA